MLPKSLLSFKNLPRWLQNTPKSLPRRSQDASKSSQDRSKSSQDPSRRAKETPKRPLRAPKTRPRGSKRLPRGSRGSQERILEPPTRILELLGIDFGAPGNDFQALQVSNPPIIQLSNHPILKAYNPAIIQVSKQPSYKGPRRVPRSANNIEFYTNVGFYADHTCICFET